MGDNRCIVYHIRNALVYKLNISHSDVKERGI
jgi:hypothetical protein